MYGTNYIFSKKFFRFWVALTLLWAFGATLVITLMPLIEGRKTIVLFWRFATGQRVSKPETMEGDQPSSDNEERVTEIDARKSDGEKV